MGWVGDDDVLCTCTHTCDMRNCWGGGVGWVGDDDVVSMGVAPQPCGNWREDATRVSRQTGVGLHLASIGGKKN